MDQLPHVIPSCSPSRPSLPQALTPTQADRQSHEQLMSPPNGNGVDSGSISSTPRSTVPANRGSRGGGNRPTRPGGPRKGRPRPPSRPLPLSASARNAPALTNVLSNQRTLDFSHHTGAALPPLGPTPSAGGVNPLWLTLSKSKQDLKAWACLSLIPNSDPELLDQSHLDSIYRENPSLHRICPLRYGDAAATEPDATASRLHQSIADVESHPKEPMACSENGNESDPIEDPDAPAMLHSRAVQAAAGIVDFDPPKLLPPGALASTSPPLPPLSATLPAANARGPTPTCAARTCKDNPNCLNYIGIAAWLEAKTRTKYISDHLMSHSSAFPTRLFHTFISNRPILRPPSSSTLGLTNLGATCYANALLQCWFSDTAFRSRVYAYATHDPVIHALALVFAGMQVSQQPWLSPRAFLEYLQVERGVQQDAQEFGKLVLQLIDDRCADFQSTGLMGGKGEYVTTCTACATETRSIHTFHEVLIHPSVGGESVQDLVDQAVRADELLEGDNAVQCQVCAAKQPAHRHLELQAVSRAICIQVLRFTYDAKTQHRKKNATSIKIPKRLQLVGEMWALTGVVVHKGRAAHAGHYVAVVRQGGEAPNQEERWILVDDEKVTLLGTRDSWTKNPINSTEAYLLYYTRERELQRDVGMKEVEVPDALIAEVKAMDSEWVEKSYEIHALQSSIESEFDSQLAHRLHLYHTLHLPTLTAPCAYLPNRLLDLVFSPTPNLALYLADPHFDPYRIVTCSHAHLDPREMHYVRRVTIQGAHELMAFVRQHAPNNLALARDPPTSQPDGRAKCKECVAEVLTHHERVAFRKDGWDAWQHVNPPEAATGASSSAVACAMYWVPAGWISECLNLQELVNPRHEHLESLRCVHQKLTPDASARVQVSEAHVEVLRSFCPDYVPSRTDELVECDVCVQKQEREQREVQERMDAALTEREQLSDVMPGDYTLLGVDEPIEFALYNARDYVRQCIDFYGGNDPAAAAAGQASGQQGGHDPIGVAHELERKLWQRYHGWIPTAPLPDHYVLLPANFIAAWWRFVLDPAAAIRPKVVRFADLLCAEHRMLKFDPRETLDRSLLRFAVIPRQVWDEHIGVFYPSDGGAGGEVVNEETPVCKECREKELLSVNGKGSATYEVLIGIRKRGGSEPAMGRGGARKASAVMTGGGGPLPNPAPLPPVFPPGILPVDIAPASRSTRSAANKKPTESSVYVQLHETVQDIKKEITQFADRIPMDQQLYLMPSGMELADRDARVLESGIYHGCTIELQVAPLMVHDSDEEEEFAAGGGRERVRDSGGFGGLLSGSGGATSDSRSQAESASRGSTGVNSSSTEVVVLDDLDEDHARSQPTTQAGPSSTLTMTKPSVKRGSVSVTDSNQDGEWLDSGPFPKRRRHIIIPEDDLDSFVEHQGTSSDVVMTEHFAQMQEDRDLAMALSMSMHNEEKEPWPQRHPGGALASHLAGAGRGGRADDVWEFPEPIEQLPKLPKQAIRDPTQMPAGGQEGVACSDCTFINVPGSTICEMCEGLLPL